MWQISGGIAIVAFLAYVYLDRARFKEAFSRRTTQYGLNSVLMSLIVLGIMVVLNMIFAGHDLKKDFTKNKLHTLSDQSVKIVKGLGQDVVLKAFVAPGQVPEFTQIFEKYTYYNKNLKTEFIDVDKDPLVVKKYNIRQPGTIIVESGTRTARVENLMGPDDPKVEERLTNAIIQVAKGDKKKLYFLIGHGEHLISDTGREGMSEMKDQLEAGRYNVADLNLLEKDKVPRRRHGGGRRPALRNRRGRAEDPGGVPRQGRQAAGSRRAELAGSAEGFPRQVRRRLALEEGGAGDQPPAAARGRQPADAAGGVLRRG